MSRDPMRVSLIGALARRRPVVALTISVAVAASLAFSLLRAPKHQATVEILLRPVAVPESGAVTQPSAGTEARVLMSGQVRRALQQRVRSTGNISAEAVPGSRILLVHATRSNAKDAADTANAYANDYIELRRQQSITEANVAVQSLQVQVTELQRQIDAASGPANGVRRDSLIDQQASAKRRIGDITVALAAAPSMASILTPAAVPGGSAWSPVRSVALGLAVGAVLGLLIAVVVEALDDAIANKEDLEVASGLPTLAVVPTQRTWRDPQHTLVITRTDRASNAAEAYRALRTAIQSKDLGEPLQSLLVTSPVGSDGKTTTLANLAVVMAHAGQRIIAVGCDLRRPRLTEFFGISNRVGFTSVLLGEVPLSAALQAVPGESRLLLLPSGPLPPNPSELLGSKRTIELLTALRANCDVVLLDSPPVLPVTDAAVMSRAVDAVILVAAAGSTRREEVARAAEILNQSHAPLIGTVLNGATGRAVYRTYDAPGPAADDRRGGGATEGAAL